MSDNLSNYLQHLVPSALSIVLPHLDNKEATYTLLAIVGIWDKEELASHQCGRLGATPPQNR